MDHQIHLQGSSALVLCHAALCHVMPRFAPSYQRKSSEITREPGASAQALANNVTNGRWSPTDPISRRQGHQNERPLRRRKQIEARYGGFLNYYDLKWGLPWVTMGYPKTSENHRYLGYLHFRKPPYVVTSCHMTTSAAACWRSHTDKCDLYRSLDLHAFYITICSIVSYSIWDSLGHSWQSISWHGHVSASHAMPPSGECGVRSQSRRHL